MTSSIHEPVIVLYKSATCPHCNTLTRIWDTPPDKDSDSVTGALRKVYPKLRFYVVTAKSNDGKFDENIAPKDLIRYGKWFPMILLIPGRLWDEAMAKLGPKNNVELINGVQTMNAKWVGSKLEYVNKYDIKKPSDFTLWIKDALENEDFKKAHHSSESTSPTPASPDQPITDKPVSHSKILTNIIKPNNSNPNYVSAGTSTNRKNQSESSSTRDDICSMRIISLPK